MKLKLAITYGILEWGLIYLITVILNHFITDDLPYIDITIPLSIIIVTTILTVLYIRNFDSNEVIEGLKLGIILFIIDLICDALFLELINNHNPIIENYPIHVISMLIMIPLITTFIGYLAQMEIELRWIIMTVPKNHPRYESLLIRDKMVKANEDGILAPSALIAHGRGEAFDYLLGEKTTLPAKRAMYVAIATMLLAKDPVISVNGNTTALVANDIIKLAKVLDAKIEINLFYRTPERVEKIAEVYKKLGYENMLGTDEDTLKNLKGIENPRATASKNGIYDADAILVPLEDGDRAEILAKTGKSIITIDLNPLSRTSIKSNVSIVDNIIRAVPMMIQIAEDLKDLDNVLLRELIENFNNKENLKDSLEEFKIKEEE